MKRFFLLLLFFGQYYWVTAQPSPYTENVFLSFEFSTQGLSTNQEITKKDGGGGIGLRAGYGFTPTFALYLGFNGARITDSDNSEHIYGLGISELGARFHIGRKLKSPTVFFDIGLQAVKAQSDESPLSFSGGGLGLGGGILAYFGQKLALEGGWHISRGKFSEFSFGGLNVTIEGDNVLYQTGRISVGITWFLSRI